MTPFALFFVILLFLLFSSAYTVRVGQNKNLMWCVTIRHTVRHCYLQLGVVLSSISHNIAIIKR